MNSVYLDSQDIGALCTDGVLEEFRRHDPWKTHREYFAQVREADLLNQMLFVDTKAFMVSLNLTYNDKMSMASSVETRVPFLDKDLVEFAAQHIPPYMKLRGFWKPATKYILRRAMADRLNPEILTQPKAGFGAPLDYWLAGDLRPIVDDLLSDTHVKRRGLFRPEFVRKMVNEHRGKTRDWSMQILQLLTLELWTREFMDGIGVRGTMQDGRVPEVEGAKK